MSQPRHKRSSRFSLFSALAIGMPYEGIDNLRPETKAAVQEFLFMMKTPEM